MSSRLDSEITVKVQVLLSSVQELEPPVVS